MIIGLEIGKRRVFAAALEWPGWCRSARGEGAAIEALLDYAPRYRLIADEAGITFDPDLTSIEVVERVEGNATTDFGAPGARYAYDTEAPSPGEWERSAALLAASYRYLDRVVAGAPAELRKGPRGGGRDRDAVAAHVLAADVEYGRKLGLPRWKPETADEGEIAAKRAVVIEVFRQATDGSAPTERGWPLRYAARRGAWHVLDHAWEIEDRSN